MRAFECSSTGLLFPGDYIEEWGRKYGIGLGPVPVSECWESNYELPPATPTRDTRSLDDCGHGVRSCMAPVFPVDVTPEEFKKRRAILNSEDPSGALRWEILRRKQDENPRSQRATALAIRS